MVHYQRWNDSFAHLLLAGVLHKKAPGSLYESLESSEWCITGLLTGALIDCLTPHLFSPLVQPSPCILGPYLYPCADCLIKVGEGSMVSETLLCCSFSLSLSELSGNVSTDEYC